MTDTLESLIKQYVWVVGIERFINRKIGSELTPRQFDSKYNSINRGKSASKELFSMASFDSHKFDLVAYRPMQPETYTNERGQTCYNLFRPSPIIPVRRDVSLWHAHLGFLFADETTRNLVLDWMAWVYEHQDQRPGRALLILGPTQGTGKSLVARIMEGIIGQDNTQRPKASSMTGDFNKWAHRCKLCIIEEIKRYTKSDGRELATSLREIITEPTIEINIKNVSQFLTENYAALMGLSNFPDALQLVEKDRRWDIARSDVTDEQKADAYDPDMKELGSYHLPDFVAWLFPGKLAKGSGPGAIDPAVLAGIAWDLKERDVSGFKIGEASMTEAKADMIQRNLPPLQRAVVDYLADNRRNLWTAEELHAAVISNVHERIYGNPKDIIGDLLKVRYGGVSKQVRLIKNADSSKKRIWGIREAAKAITLPPATIREMYLRAQKGQPAMGAVDPEQEQADFGVP